MTIVLRTTFTVNGGEEMTRDIEVASKVDPSSLDDMGRMSLAADSLVDEGQIMVCGADLVAADAVAA